MLSSVIISSTVLEAIGIAGVHSSVEQNGLEVVLFCERKFGDSYENIVCGLHDSARELGMAVRFLVLGVVVNSVGDDAACCKLCCYSCSVAVADDKAQMTHSESFREIKVYPSL